VARRVGICALGVGVDMLDVCNSGLAEFPRSKRGSLRRTSMLAALLHDKPALHTSDLLSIERVIYIYIYITRSILKRSEV